MLSSAARAGGLTLLLLASCPRRGGTSGETWAGDLPSFPGATASGSQHVSGTGMHVLCTLYVTSASPEAVVAFYASRFPDAQRASAREIEVRRPNDVVLSVHPADANVPHCNGSVKSSDKTVILVSQAIR